MCIRDSLYFRYKHTMKNNNTHKFKDMVSSHWFILALAVAGSIVVTILVIYLTPLKYLDIVPPPINEVDPAVFYKEYKAHPDQYELVDVRSVDIYTAAHAEGAISIPIENLFDEHYSLPRSGKQIALICTTGRLAAVAYGYL